MAAGVEVGAAGHVFREELAELAADHQAGGDFRQGDAGGFGDEGDGARGARVDFDYVDLGAGATTIRRSIPGNSELDVHQADDFEGAG